MKITVTRPVTTPAPVVFKVGNLYESISKLIVLCTGPKGTAGYACFRGVVVSGDGIWGAGHYSETWNEDAFTEFKGNILLEQNA